VLSRAALADECPADFSLEQLTVRRAYRFRRPRTSCWADPAERLCDAPASLLGSHRPAVSGPVLDLRDRICSRAQYFAYRTESKCRSDLGRRNRAPPGRPRAQLRCWLRGFNEARESREAPLNVRGRPNLRKEYPSRNRQACLAWVGEDDGARFDLCERNAVDCGQRPPPAGICAAAPVSAPHRHL